MRNRWPVAIAALCWLTPTPMAAGQTSDSAGGPSLTVRAAVISSLLATKFPADSPLAPEPEAATGFWRVRIEPTVRWTDRVLFESALDQRLQLSTAAASTPSGGVLPSSAAAPFRIVPLDWHAGSSSAAEWFGELDRAAVRLNAGSAVIIFGRQAVGWGRGVMFGAVDLFSPFTPLEVQREWRRGVDAVRADVPVGDRASFDVVGAFGEDIAGSAFAGRFRGYAGRADFEILGGRRARDWFGGITASAAVGGAELHGEAAVFRVPAVAGSRVFPLPRDVVKAVAGGSYRLPIGSGVPVDAEYHYSGFGAASPPAIVPMLTDPQFHTRYLRGDTQILGRHAVAVLASYEHSPALAFSGTWLQSATDRSGIFVPSATWTIDDAWSLRVNGYLPFGEEPAGPLLTTQFGASPAGLFVQIAFYR